MSGAGKGGHRIDIAKLRHVKDPRKTIEMLVLAIKQKDPSTYDHSIRVSVLSGALARHLKLSDTQVQKIVQGAIIHDLGKIAVGDSILKKPSALTHEEFHEMQHHANIGASMAAKLGYCHEVADMVRAHHEKFDGTGYPLRLKGEDIPLGARVITVADYFDALTNARVYREALPLEEVIALMGKGEGTHFDPKIMNKFFELIQTQVNGKNIFRNMKAA